MTVKLTPTNSFTLPPPNLGTYRWVDVYDPEAHTDWNTPCQSYIEQLHIVDEEITWKILNMEEMLNISFAFMVFRRAQNYE